MKKLLFIILFLFLIGCTGRGTGESEKLYIDKTTEPKIIVVNAEESRMRVKIEQQLRQKGFQIKNFSSTYVIKDHEAERDVAHAKFPTRYVLNISGSWRERCFGGGYPIVFIIAELIDQNNNETVAIYNGSGYTEDCPPLSGTIFEEIAIMVDDYWK